MSNKGEDLEYRMKRLLFYMGYYPQNNVILSTTAHDGKREEITDLDVYGTCFLQDTQYKTIYADCKSGSRKPFEKILWLKGIRDLYKIDEILFVCKTPSAAVKEMARKNNIHVLDISLIERIEKSFSIEAGDWTGSWNKANDKSHFDMLPHLGVEQQYYKSLSEFLSCTYWRNDIFDNLKKIVRALGEVANESRFIPIAEPEKRTYTWLIYKLTDMFIFTLMKLCGNLFFYSMQEIRNLMRSKIISGTLTSANARNVVNDSFRYATALVHEQYPDIDVSKIKPDFTFFEQLPNYYEPLMDLIQRILSMPQKYTNVARFANYCLYEYDFAGKKYDKDFLIDKVSSQYDNDITALKTILHFLCKELGLDKCLFQLLNETTPLEKSTLRN